MSTSTQGLDQPSTNGEGYNVEDLNQANTPQRIFPLNIESGSIIIRASPGNAGNIHLGFDDSVSTSDGFILETGDTISMDLNVSEQNIFFVGNNAGDEVRWMAIN